MNKALETSLKAKGWSVGDAADLLGMSDEQRRLLDLRTDIARAIRARRAALNLNQEALAERLNSTQPRVSLIEAADPDVSLDQLAKALIALGGTIHVEMAIAPKKTKPAGKKPSARKKPVRAGAK